MMPLAVCWGKPAQLMLMMLVDGCWAGLEETCTCAAVAAESNRMTSSTSDFGQRTSPNSPPTTLHKSNSRGRLVFGRGWQSVLLLLLGERAARCGSRCS